MKDRLPAPLYAPSDDTGSTPEQAKESMDVIENNVIAAGLIVEALTYGAQAKDIGPLLSRHCPQVLVNPAEPLKKHVVNDRIERIRDVAHKRKSAEEHKEARAEYVAFLQGKHRGTPLPDELRAEIHRNVQTYLRESKPPSFWTHDDKCRALMLPLLDDLAAGKILPIDIDRVLSAHLGINMEKTLAPFLRKSGMSVYTFAKTIRTEPEELPLQELEWGRLEARTLLAKVLENTKPSKFRKSELDKSPKDLALAAAFVELRIPFSALRKILRARSFKITEKRFARILKKHAQTEDPYAATASEIAGDIPEDVRSAARVEAKALWDDYREKGFMRRYLKSEVYETPERRAMLAVLLESGISPIIISSLMNEQYGLDINILTINQFAKAHGGPVLAAEVLKHMTTPDVTEDMLEQARNKLPSVLERHEQVKKQSRIAASKKRVANMAARKKTAEEEARLREDPMMNRLLNDVAQPPAQRHEYSTSRVSISRRIGTDGKPVMADGVTITLAKQADMHAEESRKARAAVSDFLSTLMTDAEAGHTNVLTRLLDARGYGYIRLREHGERRMQGGKLINPIEILKTIFRPERA